MSRIMRRKISVERNDSALMVTVILAKKADYAVTLNLEPDELQFDRRAALALADFILWAVPREEVKDDSKKNPEGNQKRVN